MRLSGFVILFGEERIKEAFALKVSIDKDRLVTFSTVEHMSSLTMPRENVLTLSKLERMD